MIDGGWGGWGEGGGGGGGDRCCCCLMNMSFLFVIQCSGSKGQGRRGGGRGRAVDRCIMTHGRVTYSWCARKANGCQVAYLLAERNHFFLHLFHLHAQTCSGGSSCWSHVLNHDILCFIVYIARCCFIKLRARWRDTLFTC